jgi:hypothetical protein
MITQRWSGLSAHLNRIITKIELLAVSAHPGHKLILTSK